MAMTSYEATNLLTTFIHEAIGVKNLISSGTIPNELKEKTKLLFDCIKTYNRLCKTLEGNPPVIALPPPAKDQSQIRPTKFGEGFVLSSEGKYNSNYIPKEDSDSDGSTYYMVSDPDDDTKNTSEYLDADSINKENMDSDYECEPQADDEDVNKLFAKSLIKLDAMVNSKHIVPEKKSTE
jgi:hypothetical protein